ncbi:MAG: signal peptidase [Nocardioidaceae bacterium]|jgi:signal peptidase I|nr:signal peptidase [Nocardioidaceae bacterium]
MTVNRISVDPTADGSTRMMSGAGAGRRFARGARELVIILTIALIASALIRAFVAQAFYVPTGSMLPTIQLHDKILVSRIGGIHRGEVVVFKDPGGWIPPSEKSGSPGPIRSALEFIGVLPQSSDNHLVKRVIGLPGDHLVCCTHAGRLTINGKPIDESSYLFQGSVPADRTSFDVVVPAGHLFVLGDHRYRSGDSAFHLPSQGAFVPEDLVTGRAMAVIWPLSDAHVMHIPAVFAHIPPGEQQPPATGVIKPAPTARR